MNKTDKPMGSFLDLLESGPFVNDIWDDEAARIQEELDKKPVILAGLPKTGTTTLMINLMERVGRDNCVFIDTCFDKYNVGTQDEIKLLKRTIVSTTERRTGTDLGEEDQPIRKLEHMGVLLLVDEATAIGDIGTSYLNSEAAHNSRILARLHKTRTSKSRIEQMGSFVVHYMPKMTREQMEKMLRMNMNKRGDTGIHLTDGALEAIYQSTAHSYEQCVLSALALLERDTNKKLTEDDVARAIHVLEDAMLYSSHDHGNQHFERYNIADKLRVIVGSYPLRMTQDENMFLLKCIDGEVSAADAEHSEIADELGRYHLVEERDGIYVVSSVLTETLYTSMYRESIENGTYADNPLWGY